jgi:hypothetical protein
MNKLVLATLPLLLGGAAATALALRSPPKQAAVAVRAKPPAVRAGRIAVSPAELREAYAAGLIDRPIKTILDVRSPMTYGDFRWDDKGVPAGPTWVRVDLDSQILSVFRSGEEVGTAVILYGADGVPTPTGKFPILAKLRDHRSVTYDNAPMPFTLRLTADGVSIHGSNVRWGFATHGCIGVPAEFAARLFDVVKTGDEVLIVAGKARRHNREPAA